MFWVKTPMFKKDAYATVTEGHILVSIICRDFKCESVSFEAMRHWELGKYKKEHIMWSKSLERKGEEPFYGEKLQILHDVGVWKKVALEVFPPVNELVDRENFYHMWEFENLSSLHVDTHPIFSHPNRFTKKFEDIHYETVGLNGAVYIYFQSDDKVPWRKKQALKNHVVGPTREGVEIITDSMLGVGYGVMIIWPKWLRLSFGLI